MRIIRGKYGRRRFDVPNNITARPTTDFARENIFNVLENLVDFEEDAPTALDLFSGTGAITFEFLSRGCRSVTSVEKAATQYNFIAKVAKQLNVDNLRQIKGDALKFIPAATQSYDIVFADPPYDLPGFADIPQAVLDSKLLHDGSIFIIEHSKNHDFSSLPGFKEHRAYGSVNFSIFIKEPDIKQYPMKSISLNTQHAVTADQVKTLAPEAAAALAHVMNADAPGNDFLGWVNLPSQLSDALLDDIAATAADLNAKCDTVVAIGIGGSYLGAKAIIDALGNSVLPFIETKSKTPVLFAGHNIGEDYLHDLMEYLKDRTYGIIVISKSGTTTEPAIAFRLLKDMLEKKLGKKEAASRIVAITDAHRGALRQLATEEGYKTYVIDDNVGGRFSVLTPVGLLPIAVAGYDIHALVGGARMMEAATAEAGEENVAMQYAIARNILYRQGKKIEILVNYNPKLHYVGEWWKQLYGESEGKDHKGIFPAAVDNSTDLHSMGQWIQDGERTIFETVISVEEPNSKVVIPTDEANLDGLNYIAGKRVDEVNKMAELGTRIAHVDGGVPNLRITIPAVNEESLGQLLYFFEKACGISGYMLEVNPFNQPGVEAYKKNMFALLEKPGYEAETQAIKARL